MVDGQAELAINPLVGRGRAEPLDAEDHPALTHPAVPRLRHRGLHSYPRAHRRRGHQIAVLGRLAREQLHRRHTHDPPRHPFGDEPLVRPERHLDPGSPPDEPYPPLAPPGLAPRAAPPT